jgi:hypothetical protein
MLTRKHYDDDNLERNSYTILDRLIIIIYNIQSKLRKTSKPNHFQSAKENDDVDDGTILDPFKDIFKSQTKQKIFSHLTPSHKNSHTRHELLCK